MTAGTVVVIIAVCAAWFVAGILVERAWSRGRTDLATARRVDSARTQLENTQVHHVDTRAKTPHDRPRVKDPTGE